MEWVVVLVLMFHEERLVLGVHDNKTWQIPSDVVDENPCGALRLAESPTEYWNTPANTRVADAEKIIRRRTTKIPNQLPVQN